ncbi:MAG TPA: hypothetical protein VGO69_03760, partial [Pyrinomonadaceae bacterium]|nr:hypothetical protein [Pyrinomonadaceae bacterium]
MINKRRYGALFFFALLLVGTLAAGSPLAKPRALSAAQKKFDPEGEFNPLGNAPKGLEEVGHIDLFRSGLGRPFTSHTHSGVVTTRGVVYRFRTISASQNNFT